MENVVLDRVDALERCLGFLLMRPERKERTRRVIKALDEQVEGWETVTKHPEFKTWLLEQHPVTQSYRSDILIGAWDYRDAETLVTLFCLFVDHMAGNRPRHYGDRLRDTDRKVGDLIHADYEVIDLLGIGGFGEVFLTYSHNEKVQSFYALKVIKTGVVDEDDVRRFEIEARLLLSLEPSPYIVAARFIEKRGTQVSLAMDYVRPDRKGRVTLQQHVQSGSIKLKEQVKWAIECCAGLATAYKSGIKAHRDIKPANILIDASRRACISDFGLASLGLIPGAPKFPSLIIREGSGDASRTIEGSSFGTPAYMAPEQFVNAHACDVRSDIYSLGVTLFEMASNGALPYMPWIAPNDRRINLFAVFSNLHANAELPTLDSPLFPLIARCCAKAPKNRFQTVEELQHALLQLSKRLGLPDIPLIGSQLSVMEQYNRTANQAVAHARFGEHEKAIPLYKEALQLFDLGGVAFDMGLSLQKLGRYQEALDAYLSLKTARTADVELSIAYCQAKLHGWQSALSHFHAATELAPDNLNAWENLARGYAATAQHDQAAKAFERLVKLPGVQATHWLEKGQTEFELGRIPDAQKSVNTALYGCAQADGDVAVKAKSLLTSLKKVDFYQRVKKILGPGFNDARLKAATDATFDGVSKGAIDEARAIQVLRGVEPAITYSQAEKIYCEFLAPSS